MSKARSKSSLAPSLHSIPKCLNLAPLSNLRWRNKIAFGHSNLPGRLNSLPTICVTHQWRSVNPFVFYPNGDVGLAQTGAAPLVRRIVLGAPRPIHAQPGNGYFLLKFATRGVRQRVIIRRGALSAGDLPKQLTRGTFKQPPSLPGAYLSFTDGGQEGDWSRQGSLVPIADIRLRLGAIRAVHSRGAATHN